MKHWTDDERNEYEALIIEAIASGSSTAGRVDTMEIGIDKAVRAEQSWAVDVQREAARDGYNRMLKAFDAKSRRVFVSYDGKILDKPRVVGVKTMDVASGRMYVERALIDVMTWDQVEQKIVESSQGRRAYGHNEALYRRLMSLRKLAPESTGPTDAAEYAGVDLDEWLLTEDGAA